MAIDDADETASKLFPRIPLKKYICLSAGTVALLVALVCVLKSRPGDLTTISSTASSRASAVAQPATPAAAAKPEKLLKPAEAAAAPAIAPETAAVKAPPTEKPVASAEKTDAKPIAVSDKTVTSAEKPAASAEKTTVSKTAAEKSAEPAPKAPAASARARRASLATADARASRAPATPANANETAEAPKPNLLTKDAAATALADAKRIDEAAEGALAEQEKARALYQQALDSGKLDDDAEAFCVSRLHAFTDKIILNPKVACSAPKAVFHDVEPGEGAERIARKYKVTQLQLKRINKLGDKLTVRFDQTLKILPGDVVYRVNRARLHGTLYIDGVFIRRYPVGVGPGSATALGTYTIANKVVNPDWWYEGRHVPYGDPENILGTRWMGFAGPETRGAGLGVHGTMVPASVPGRESKGCVRMLNADVEELYDLMPQGGKVVIFESGARIDPKPTAAAKTPDSDSKTSETEPKTPAPDAQPSTSETPAPSTDLKPADPAQTPPVDAPASTGTL